MTARGPAKGDSDFLGRWSRLKRERAAEEEAGPAPAELAQEAPPEARTDEEILAELGLPHPETLKAGDDFSAFMAKTVPAHLRRIALRRLWTSKPELACLDGLVDYADDYTDAALAVDRLTTSYRVGRGFLTDDRDPVSTSAPDERAARAGSGADGAGSDPTAGAGPAPGAGADGAAPEARQSPPGEPLPDAEVSECDAAPAEGETAARAAPRRARMRFRPVG